MIPFNRALRFLDGTDVTPEYLELVRYYAEPSMEAELFYTLDQLEMDTIL